MRNHGDDTIRVLGKTQHEMEAKFTRLNAFLARAESAGADEVEAFFVQAAADLNEALARPPAQASAFVIAIQTASRAAPAAFASPARVECLLSLAQYQYLIGQPLLGVEPAADASEYARRVENQPLLRKAAEAPATPVQRALSQHNGRVPRFSAEKSTTRHSRCPDTAPAARSMPC